MILIPYIGLDLIRLYSDYKEVKNKLDSKEIKYVHEIWDNSDCDVPYNWNVLYLETGFKLFFSEGNNKLFKIYAESPSTCEMDNGIAIGNSIDKAIFIDTSLKYNEMDEIYESEYGYWLETDMDDKVVSLTVFVKEINNEDFDECRW